MTAPDGSRQSAAAVSKQILSEALCYAASNDLGGTPFRAQALIRAEVAQRYADLVQALDRERKNVTQMLAVARAAIAHCLDAADGVAATDPAAAGDAEDQSQGYRLQRRSEQLARLGRRRVVIEPSHIADGLDRERRLIVEELKLGHRQLGPANGWSVRRISAAAGAMRRSPRRRVRATHMVLAANAPPNSWPSATWRWRAVARTRWSATARESEEICLQLQ